MAAKDDIIAFLDANKSKLEKYADCADITEGVARLKAMAGIP